jgi:ubiquinone/menaquinone biosynthesis C-methylase UbiE
VPPEIRAYPPPGAPPRANDAPSFDTVTEVPGTPANAEQIAMLWARYGWAGAMARGKDVLEVACGSGIGLGHLAAHARRVVGVDVDPKLVEIGRRQYGRLIEIEQADAHSLPFSDGAFDVVILFEAIYYLDRPETFLQEARRVLRPGGRVLVCSANCERPEFNVSPFSKQYYSANALRELLEQNGFQPDVFAGFSVKPQGQLDQVRNRIRTAAVRLRLIPKTMKWKARLKRLFFGRLEQLPPALGAVPPAVEPIVPVDANLPQLGHKVLYAIGHRDAQSQRTAA